MRISANEIANVGVLGILDGVEIKLITTKGGLHLAMGRDHKGGESIIGAASHPAILSYNLERKHPGFCSALLKSESEFKPHLDKHSHFLPDDLRKSGHDIYSIQQENQIEFMITRHEIKVGAVSAEIIGDTLMVKSLNAEVYLANPSAIVNSVAEKACSMGIKKVKMG